MTRILTVILCISCISVYSLFDVEVQKIYEMAYMQNEKKNQTVLLNDMRKLNQDGKKRLLQSNITLYEKLSEQLLKLSVDNPITRQDYILLREFSAVYPLEDTKHDTFPTALACYFNDNWKEAEKILNLLLKQGNDQPGILLLLGTMYSYQSKDDSGMLQKVLLKNPYGTLDFFENVGIITATQMDKLNLFLMISKLFGLIEKEHEISNNEYIQTKLRHIANLVLFLTIGVHEERNVSEKELKGALQNAFSFIERQPLFQIFNKTLSNVTYKLKYELDHNSLFVTLEIENCSTPSLLKKVVFQKEKIIAN